MKRRAIVLGLVSGAALLAQEPAGVSVSISGGDGDLSKAVSILLIITVLSLAPSLIMMMTSFTRIVVVLSFFRQAMGIQQVVSMRIMAALALFLTFFIMAPTFQQVYEQAYLPYRDQEISQQQAFAAAKAPLLGFMLVNTHEESLLLFMELGQIAPVADTMDLPMRVVIPAFMISELKTAFQMAFLLYLPFLVVDMLIATILMSMGMMMVPPIMVSLPFKLMLFILVGGWDLLVRVLVSSFM